MRAFLLALVTGLTLLGANPKPKVKLTTSMGAIVLQLEPEVAPKTVDNFLKYVKDGFYNGTIFHRVMPTFMIQGGGYTKDLVKKPQRPPIPNEADSSKAKGLLNKRGTIALALPVGNPFGGASEFFINVKDNANLDFKAKTMTEYGYCAFGKVIQGMEVVDKIKAVKVKKQGVHETAPINPILIEKAEVVS